MMLADHFWIFVAALVCVSTSRGAPPAPESLVALCKRNDPNLDECVLKSGNELRSKLTEGVKGLKIPPLDPLVIPKIHLAQGDGPVSLESTFNDVHIRGMSGYQLKKMHVDFDKKEIQVDCFTPIIETNGKYKIDGKILALPISGSGDSRAKYSDVVTHVNFKFKPETRDGKEYWNLEKSDLDLDVKHADIHMDNLFNGNKQLGETMNQFISENWRAVFQELKPTVSDTINVFVSDFVGKMFKAYPIDDLFPV